MGGGKQKAILVTSFDENKVGASAQLQLGTIYHGAPCSSCLVYALEFSMSQLRTRRLL